MKINDAIQRLEKYTTALIRPDSKDTIKYGDPEQECTGIVVTVFGSIDVIRKAHELGCNLIITHESIFFGDEFQLRGFIDNDVLAEKRKLLRETGIVVYRHHDRIHGGGPGSEKRLHPDYIFTGIMHTLGWEAYLLKDADKPLWFKLPETTVGQLTNEIVEKLHLNGARIIGNLEDKVSTVFLCEHIMGRFDQQKINDAVHADVIIPFEVCDWTVSEYVRDALSLHQSKAMIEVGHFNMEEAGLKDMVNWLPKAIGTDLPIHFVQSGDAFQYIGRPTL